MVTSHNSLTTRYISLSVSTCAGVCLVLCAGALPGKLAMRLPSRSSTRARRSQYGSPSRQRYLSSTICHGTITSVSGCGVGLGGGARGQQMVEHWRKRSTYLKVLHCLLNIPGQSTTIELMSLHEASLIEIQGRHEYCQISDSNVYFRNLQLPYVSQAV